MDYLSPGVRHQPGQYGKTLSLQKISKISWAWWCMPVVSAIQEAEVGRSRGQEFETSLANIVQPVSTKNTKINCTWWHVSEIPDTQEAEVGKLLEPGRRKLQ